MLSEFLKNTLIFFYNYVKIVTIYNLNANIITKNGTLEVPKLNGASDGLISEPHFTNIIISIDKEISQVLIQKIQRLIAA